MALTYHQGQIEVQTEANTRRVADMLARWVGPVGEFCATSDMIVLAVPDRERGLEFLAVSGAAPVVEIVGPSTILARLDKDEPSPRMAGTVSAGGIAINMAMARRARLNGTLTRTDDGLLLQTEEAFTNCRKYVVPSVPLASRRHFGPVARDAVGLEEGWTRGLIDRAETSFLASVSPDGCVDVSHRGGPPGFLRLDADAGGLEWDEYVGDGMLKSAGNVRATGRFALLVPDMSTGDGLELQGTARVEVIERDKRPRTEGLLQHKEDFPVQGKMVCGIEAAYRLTGMIHPRQRLEKRQRFTSASPTRDQAPQ